MKRLASAGRFLPLALLTIACLAIGEEYPFSNFPMYRGFTRMTTYVYLADASGQPLATVPTLGITTPTLKKLYESEVRQEMQKLRTSRRSLSVEQRRPAGERLLASLATTHGGDGRPLRLYEVTIALGERGFDKRTELIAEKG